ncbi:hypothetical protein JCM3774_002967, partial [Rhodotorula dairenensis]
IRASLVQGRLSQPTRSFLVTRAAPLSFSSSSSSAPSSSSGESGSSWRVIQERLEGWKGALERVTQTVEKSLNVSGSSGSGAGAGASRSEANGRAAGSSSAEGVHHHQQAIEV